jgi:hypothetical protein
MTNSRIMKIDYKKSKQKLRGSIIYFKLMKTYV